MISGRRICGYALCLAAFLAATALAAGVDAKQDQLQDLKSRIETLRREMAAAEESRTYAADQLRETAMALATRRVVPIADLPDQRENTLRLFNLLMGKGEASSRRAWMEEKGHLIEADI